MVSPGWQGIGLEVVAVRDAQISNYAEAASVKFRYISYSAKPDYGFFMESLPVQPAGMSAYSFLEPLL